MPLRLLLLVALLAPTSLLAQEADPALEKYYAGNALYNRKNYPVAVAQYEAFLKENGGHAKADLARRGLGLSLYALKQYDKAIPHLSALLSKGELDASISRERIVMLQGQCLMALGKKDDARKLFEAEIGNLKADSYRAGALAAICDACFGKSEWDAVVKWSGQLLGAKPQPEQAARGLYQQGYAQYQLKKPDEAIASLAKVAGLGADAGWKTRADYLLGECHNLKQDYPKAEAAFVAALPGLQGPDAAECRYRLGLTRFVLKKYKEAAADLSSFLEGAKDSPRAPEAKLYIARSHLELGDFDKAAPTLGELAGKDGDIGARAGLWLARVHTRKDKNYDKAAEVLGAAVGKAKGSAVADDLRFDYANALMAGSAPDWKKALELLAEVERGGKFAQIAEVLSQKAVCQHKLAAYDGSLASNEAFLSKHGESPLAADARFMKAENLFLLNRLDDAAAAYGEFTSKHADHPNANAAGFRLAQINHDQGKWAECLAIAGPMLAKKPEGKLFDQLPFLVGDCLFRQEKWAEAAKALDGFLAERVKGETIAAEANVDTALMQRAVAYDRLDQKDKALKDLGLLVTRYPEASPQMPLALAEWGRLAFEAGDLKTARAALERFTTEDAKEAAPFNKGAPAQRARVNYYLGWVESSEEKHDAAAERFAKVLEIDAKHALAPDAALQQGIAWVSGGKFEQAAEHFPKMLGQYPKHPKLARLVYYSGLALARQEQWDPAKKHFKRVAEQFADSEFADQALYEWAWCERKSNRDKEAVKLYERLIAKHGESPLAVKVQSELAELNLESGDMDKVIAGLTENLAKVKDEKLREDIRYQLASAHFKKGDHDKSAAQFEAMLTDYPESKLMASILFQAGESRLKLGEAVKARDHFGKAAASSAVPAGLGESITMRLAETRALTGQHAEAKAAYADFLAKYPESRWTRNAQFGLAFATESAGDSAGAIPVYKKLLADKSKVDLWTVRSRFQLGECLFNQQKYDDAVAEFVNVEINYAKYPDWQAKAVLEMGRVLTAQGKKEQAAERFKDVIRRYPKQKAATVAQQYLDELRNS